MFARTRRGFTLVELLVVIAIIGMLMALVIPAVIGSRENVRRAQCINNQGGQLALAIVQYEQRKQKLPGWNNRIVPSTQPFSWAVPILPDVGAKSVYDNIYDGLIRSPATATYVPTAVEVLLCPSDTVKVTSGGTRLSYVCNAGYIDDPNKNDFVFNGPFMNRFPSPLPAGTTDVRLDTIARWDGLATTILLTENLDATYYFVRNATLYEYDVGVVWQDPTKVTVPLNRTKRRAVDPANPTPPYNAAMYNHALPSSNHPGGFVVAMGDRSAKFMSADVDYKVYCSLMTARGREARLPGDTTTAPTALANNSQLATVNDSMLNP